MYDAKTGVPCQALESSILLGFNDSIKPFL